jgi:hypothetical protein
VIIQAAETRIIVTKTLLIVERGERSRWSMPLADVRRVELRVERGRPIQLLVVPEDPIKELQLLAIPRHALPQAMRVLARVERSVEP